MLKTLSLLKQALCSTDAQLVLRETYETVYGIYNHDGPEGNHPLAAVLMSDKENVAKGGLLYERIRQHRECQVYKTFGLSLTEWLDLPRDVCIEVLEQAKEEVTRTATAANNAATVLNNQMSR